MRETIPLYTTDHYNVVVGEDGLSSLVYHVINVHTGVIEAKTYIWPNAYVECNSLNKAYDEIQDDIDKRTRKIMTPDNDIQLLN